ncbi:MULTISPECIES: Lrp/AsnC family transcriptional regulator [Glutamicibacter]
MGANLRFMVNVDMTDRRILLALTELAKRSAASLAEHLNLGRNTVQSRLNRLENEVLLGQEVRVPPHALGYNLLAFIELHVEQHHLASITEALAKMPQVLEAHGLTGSADILVRVCAVDAHDLFRIHGQLLHLPGVTRADSALAMADLVPYRTSELLRHSLSE